MRMIAGVLAIHAGTVLWQGREITAAARSSALALLERFGLADRTRDRVERFPPGRGREAGSSFVGWGDGAADHRPDPPLRGADRGG
jgi:hypothetical protein